MEDPPVEKPKKRRGPGRPFPPGVSGNPAGRPKGIRYVSEAIRELLAEEMEDGKTIAYKIARVCVLEASKGNVAMVKEILDRTEGRAKERIEADVTLTDDSESARSRLLAELNRLATRTKAPPDN